MISSSNSNINKDNKIILNEKDGRIWIVGKHGDDSLVVEKKLIPNFNCNRDKYFYKSYFTSKYFNLGSI